MKRATRKLNRDIWDRYVNGIECDVHGAQLDAYKIMKYLNKSEKDTAELNNISEEEWLQYLKRYGPIRL